MSEYIDKELALSFPWANGKYDHEHADENFILGLETYKEWLETLEPTDAVEVKHGKWDCEKHIILNSTAVYIKWKCSNCGVVAKKGLSYDDINNYAPSYLYCPECGAKMDAGDK